jgi:hypothetical protein
VFLGLKENTLEEFIRACQRVDDAVFDMANNSIGYVDTFGVTAAQDLADLAEDAVGENGAITAMKIDTLAAIKEIKDDGLTDIRDFIHDALVDLSGFGREAIKPFIALNEGDGGIRDQIQNIGGIIAFELDTIAADPRGVMASAADLGEVISDEVARKPSESIRSHVKNIGNIIAYELNTLHGDPDSAPLKSAKELGEALTEAVGKAISDSARTNVIDELIDAVEDALEEAIEEAEDAAEEAARRISPRALLDSPSARGSSDMDDLIAEVRKLNATILRARSIDLTYTQAVAPGLLQDVAMLEALAQSGT